MDEKLDKLIRLLIGNGISLNRVGDWFCCTELELDFSEHDKAFEDKIAELDEKYLCMIKTAEQHQDARMFYKKENESLNKRIAELKSENEKLFDYLNGITGNTKAEIKNNIKNIEKIDKKPTKRTGVIIAREIDGQTYVLLDDFMSAVNDLQAKIGT